jgi:hypothetical protein
MSALEYSQPEAAGLLWMAPALQEEIRRFGALIGFSLLSGLLMQPFETVPKGLERPDWAQLRLSQGLPDRNLVLGRRRLKDGNGSVGLNYLFEP